MFQYAFGRRVSQELGYELQFDLSFLDSKDHDELHVRRQYSLDLFGINGPFYQGNIHSDLQWVVEKKFNYDPELIVDRDNVLLDGYFQTERYFEPIADEIYRTFSSVQQTRLDGGLINRFRSPDSVCINVRRGDFVNNERSRSFHGVLGMDYIRTGVEVISKSLKSPRFFVFSDDVEWCRANVKLDYPVEVVGHEFAGDRFVDYLHYMSKFQNYIIPNSSFAWWAVWLSHYSNGKTNVVCPKQWFLDDSFCFDDLIPPSWIRI